MSTIRQESDTDTGPVTPIYALPVDHLSAWKATDFRSPADYSIELTATQLRDLKSAMGRMKGGGSRPR